MTIVSVHSSRYLRYFLWSVSLGSRKALCHQVSFINVLYLMKAFVGASVCITIYLYRGSYMVYTCPH